MPDVLAGLDVWGKAASDYTRTGYYAGIFVDPANLLEVAKKFFENDYILEDVSGADFQEGIMVVYHFDRLDQSGRITVRVLTSHEAPSVPSISSIFSGADWHERECYDFFGVIFEGHPNLKPLLLPDDLGEHPLIKVKDRQSFYGILPFEQMVVSNS